jgi:hypothetical protein
MAALAVLALGIGLAVALTSGGGKSRGERGSHHPRSRQGTSGGSSSSASASRGKGPASGGSNATPARIELAARYLGLSTTELHDRLRRGASLARVAEQTPGRSAHGLVEALLAAQAARLRSLKLSEATRKTRLKRYRERIERLVAHSKASPAIERDLLAASAYLAIGDGRLHTLLEQGQTLAQIAQSIGGRSSAGLKEAILKSRRERLRAAATAGLLSRKDEQAALAALPARVESELHRKLLQAPTG